MSISKKMHNSCYYIDDQTQTEKYIVPSCMKQRRCIHYILHEGSFRHTWTKWEERFKWGGGLGIQKSPNSTTFLIRRPLGGQPGPRPSFFTKKIYEILVYFANTLITNNSRIRVHLWILQDYPERTTCNYVLLFLHFASFDCDCWIMRRDALFSLYSLAVATSPAAELAGHCRLDIGRRAQGS